MAASRQPAPRRRRPSASTLQALQAGAGALGTAAVRRIEASHEWFRALPPDERSWIGLIAQAGVAAFVGWLADPDPEQPLTADIFATAPRELAAAITLSQTLELVRSVVDVIEEQAGDLARPGDEQILRESVLRYSREIAFGAAEVYARAAEARGAWDARLEALVVDAVLRGEADDSMQSRATALGWGSVADVTVVAGRTPPTGAAGAVEAIRRDAAREGVEALAAVQRRRLVIVLGGTREPLAVVARLAEHFGPGPVVVGPTVPHLFAAGRSARAALNGLTAAPAWPGAPRPVSSDELLPERVLVGDEHARRQLVARIVTPLAASPELAETAAAYLDAGGIEAAARRVFVHANTVRYRLARIAELTGYEVTTTRDGYAVRLALALGRLGRAEPAAWRSGLAARAAEDPRL
ncbi:MAG TPA: helix-turn-helix domain-containing protein [Dermatophilaceae bacterium]|nr:helix-turn-helix domain-containing protein [Dermatophilaceae bacterium]